MSDQHSVTVKIVGGLSGVKRDAWDAIANPEPARFNPFTAYDFLRTLEDAKCVGPGTGWMPRHLLIEDDGGGLAAAAPCYAKGHSQGEYVFDHAWADAFQRAGGRYYPKLQIAVPFTPVPGPRLFVKSGPAEADHFQALAQGAMEMALQAGLSSIHVTFADAATQARLTPLGFLARTGQQFHWSNHGYTTFTDFLETFASRKRKGVRKERAEALSGGLTIEHLRGRDITESHWDAFFRFYIDTGNRKWGRPYLNREFFSLLGARMSEHCLLVMVKRDGRYIAGALNMIGGDCLYGRYWGAIEHHPFLHFEVCYYQAIDYAIANGLSRVEAGAQGEHKLARGYLPVETHSSHWIADPHLRAGVARYLTQERIAVTEENEELAELGPYRKTEA